MEDPDRSNEGDPPSTAVDELCLAVALARIVEHLGQATDAYSAGRALTLGFKEWLGANKVPITVAQRDAVLAAIAGARVAISDTIPRASLTRVEDGLDALAEDVAAAAGATMFGTVDHAGHCAVRIALAQAEAATVAMLVSALFDDLENRPRALAYAADWQVRASKLAAHIAERHQPGGVAI